MQNTQEELVIYNENTSRWEAKREIVEKGLAQILTFEQIDLIKGPGVDHEAIDYFNLAPIKAGVNNFLSGKTTFSQLYTWGVLVINVYGCDKYSKSRRDRYLTKKVAELFSRVLLEQDKEQSDIEKEMGEILEYLDALPTLRESEPYGLVRYIGNTQENYIVENNYMEFQFGEVYEVIEDDNSLGWLRVVDESDEDYLYPKELFGVVDKTPELVRAFLAGEKIAVAKK